MSRKTEQGKVSFYEIYDAAMRLIERWNRQNPDRAQRPIFRSNISGRLLFRVADPTPSEKKDDTLPEAEDYRVVQVRSISTGQMKRLAALIVLNGEADQSRLARITWEVMEKIRYSEYTPEGKLISTAGADPAREVWCYFGRDERDIRNSLHCAYTIWAADPKGKELCFRPNKNAGIVEGIYVWQNASYQMLRNLQASTKTRAEYIDEMKQLRSAVISQAEHFAYDLQEVANRTLTADEMQGRYAEWITLVRRSYFLLADEDLPPADLHDWSEEILDLAGWAADMSILLKGLDGDGTIRENELWLMRNAVRHYRDSIEKLKMIEQNMTCETL